MKNLQLSLKGAVLYISFTQSVFSDRSQLVDQQINTLLYKKHLATRVSVTYLLNNNLLLDELFGEMKLASVKKNPFAFLLHAIRFIKKNKFDFVIVHSLDNFLQAALISFFTGARVVLQHHAETTYRRKKAVLMPLADKLIAGYFFNGKLVAKAFYEKKHISEEKIFEVTEGTNAFQLMEQKIGSTIRNLLFIGRLNENKNLITVLKAINIIRLTRSDFKLSVYYATNELENELKGFCREHELHDLVYFKGSVSNSEIEKVLQSADIFVSASFYEGSGYALIEALACGVFPVVSKIPSFDYLLENLAEKSQFDPKDEQQLAACLLSALDGNFDRSLRQTIRNHFEAQASPQAIAAQVEAALFKHS